jgi:hypothetical protein
MNLYECYINLLYKSLQHESASYSNTTVEIQSDASFENIENRQVHHWNVKISSCGLEILPGDCC